MAFSVTSGKSSVPEVFESLAAAITTACDLIKRGVAVHQIKGSDGFIMEQRDIEIEYSRRCAAPRLNNNASAR
jgi:hypothetical protein